MRNRPPCLAAILGWLILGSLPLGSGCDGCRSPQADAPADSAVPATDYTFGGAQPLPQGLTVVQSGVKPGHWFGIAETLRSNRADQRGTLRHSIEWSFPGEDAAEGLAADGQAAAAATQRLPLHSERPAVLPQGRTRRLDSRLLAGAPQTLGRGARGFLSGQFRSQTQGGTLQTGRQSVNLLQPQEYFFVVLTQRPERFAWTQTADWVRPLAEEAQLPSDLPANYRLVFPRVDGVLALPETMLDWTSTAVLLWDDLEPTALTPEQERAIVDWVHFGGRLIVNGPAAASALSRGRFAELLPLQVQASGELEPEAAAELLRSWSVSGDPTTDAQAALVRQQSGRLVALGPPRPEATTIDGTAGLVLGRPAGRGQVVLSRFDVASDWVREWRSRDNFFNAVLLGRPGRLYVTSGGGEDANGGQSEVTQFHLLPIAAETPGADRSSGAGTLPGAEATRPPGERRASDRAAALRVDAAVNTGFRLLARDARLVGPVAEEFASDPDQGIGGWRDNSDAASLAVQTLRDQSGVEIPPREFVFRSLALYLLILVPLNYLVFRLLGRLEWAWLAVPVIGLGGAAWIARGASLDVGLARSRTEIAIVELQTDHPRGHVTRFVALYNSLSRQYDLAFDSPDAAAAPLGILGQVPEVEEQRRPLTLRYGFGAGPTLAGVAVESNRTRILHTEQVIDFGGAVRLHDGWLQNGTSLDLREVWLIGKTDAGQVRVAALGACDAGSRVGVQWRDGATVDLPAGLPLQTQDLLVRLAQSDRLGPGAVRLVAHCDQQLPGLEIRPAPAQHSAAAVVVAHLAHPQRGVGGGDENLPPERLERQRARWLDDELDD